MAAAGPYHDPVTTSGHETPGDDRQTTTTLQAGRAPGSGTPSLATPSPAERYQDPERLGRGGMGEVTRVSDLHLGRDVAMKALIDKRRSDASAVALFAAEARLQAQLQHPSIVPVYEFGEDDDGNAYFTMRPIAGTSLADALDGGTTSATRRELLGAMVRVALAVDYAHGRRVIHCDLKPSNIMLGSFGEVYVVDWGAARRLDDDTATHSAIVGSPAYMPPERAQGRDHLLGPRTDVYSFGAVVFEIATGQSFADAHEHGGLSEASLAAIDEQLAVICVKATSSRPDARYESMRAVADALQSFLDGEADRARQVQESEQESAAALAIARGPEGGIDEVERRQEAVRAVGRALALNPHNQTAIEAMVELVSKPMVRDPDGVQRLADDANNDRTRRLGKVAAIAYLAQLLHLPLLFSGDVRQPGYLWAFYGAMLVSAALAWSVYRRPSALRIWTCLATSSLGAAALAGLLGPLLVMPMIVIVNAAAYGLLAQGRSVVLPLVLGALAISTPVAFMLLGAVPSPYTFAGESMRIDAAILALDERAPGLLFLINVITLAFGVLTTQLLSQRVRSVERQLFSQMWHFRQLLPSGSSQG